jgi:hypothetical protein
MNAGTVLVIAFISAGLGYLAGLVLTRSSKDREKETTEGGETGPRYEIHKLEVTLWSKTPHGPLLADFFGHTVQSRDEVSVPEKNRLIQEIRTIEAWFGIGEHKTNDAAPVVNSTPSVTSEPLGTASTVELPPAPATPPELVATSVTSHLPVENLPVHSEIDLEELSEAQIQTIMPPPPVAPVQPRLDNRAKVKSEPVIKSIVEQINDILQEKVTRSNIADVGIKLQETPQGVLVWVGKTSYQGIDTVPEGEAKTLIKAAVKEWEKR